MTLKQQCQLAKKSASILAKLSSLEKNEALLKMKKALLHNTQYLLSENAKDIQHAKDQPSAIIDRLTLTEKRIADMANGLETLISLPDPIGQTIEGWVRPNGLSISKIRVPIGVIGIVYEARPNVTVDAAGLCLKSGNAVVLRGSSTTLYSNQALVEVLKMAVNSTPFPQDTIQLIADTRRETVQELIKMNGILDLIIPRGGAGLIQSVVTSSTVPVIETGVGNCHIYIDQDADINKTIPIVVNAKMSRPSVCNACETLLIHEKIAGQILPLLQTALQGVLLKGCPKTCEILPITPATIEDWKTEYLDLILAIKIVKNVEEAIQHIQDYSSAHTEAILSENYSTIEYFLNSVDATTLMVNASTRFTDGSEFGFGAEMGISTQKIHARGPIGLPELTTYKYIVRGTGQIRPS